MATDKLSVINDLRSLKYDYNGRKLEKIYGRLTRKLAAVDAALGHLGEDPDKLNPITSG